MATYSSPLAWKIPWTEEPGRLQCMGSLRVGHDWATSFSLFTFMHWRRKWQPTPVFLPEKSQGRGSLVGCRLWGWTQLKRLSRSSSSWKYEWFQINLKINFEEDCGQFCKNVEKNKHFRKIIFLQKKCQWRSFETDVTYKADWVIK